MSELRNRAHGNEVATTEEQEQAAAIERASGQIRKMEEQFKLAMPRGIEATQLVRDALTLVRQNPKLATTDPKSMLGGLMTMAQLGLRPGVLGHGWLVPFWDKHSRTFKAQLIIGYQGYIDLGYRSNQVAAISARTVFANDPIFEVAFGTVDELFHRPTLDDDKGDPIAYYAVAHIKDGRPMFYPKSHPDMIRHRDRYAMAQKDGVIIAGTPWADHFESMAHKTCLRQLAKWMPKSTELATAIQVDEGFRTDLTGRPEDTTWHAEQIPATDAQSNKEESR